MYIFFIISVNYFRGEQSLTFTPQANTTRSSLSSGPVYCLVNASARAMWQRPLVDMSKINQTQATTKVRRRCLGATVRCLTLFQWAGVLLPKLHHTQHCLVGMHGFTGCALRFIIPLLSYVRLYLKIALQVLCGRLPKAELSNSSCQKLALSYKLGTD